MDVNEKVTNAGDIALPVELVTLTRLKTRDGSPVVVRCEMLPEESIAEVFKALPGSRVEGVGDDVEVDALEELRRLGVVAPALLEQGTSLDGPDGRVRPAFYAGEKAPHPLSIPMRYLHVEDKVALCAAIMRLGGYLPGGTPTDGTFHGDDGGGAGDGAGVVAAGAGDGDDAVGGAA